MSFEAYDCDGQVELAVAGEVAASPIAIEVGVRRG